MKTAFVTGASGGIGLTIAKALASEYQVTTVARNLAKLEEQIHQFEGNGHSALNADLSAHEGIEKIKVHLEDNRYNVLINNAGVGLYGRFEERSLEEQLKMTVLNIDALVTLPYAFLGSAQRGDALVNIASVLGSTSFPGVAAYAGTKGFILRFSESLWYEQTHSMKQLADRKVTSPKRLCRRRSKLPKRLSKG